MNELVLRAKLRHYMEVGSPLAFQLVGDGFTAFNESKNAKEYSRQYVHMTTELTDVIGFSPSIGYASEIYTEDAVCQHVVRVTDNEYVGAAAQVDIVAVNLFDQIGANVYRAYKRRYTIVPDGKGDGVEALVYTGNLKAVSDLIPGTFNTSTKTFNATAAPALTFTCTAGTAAGDTEVGDIDPAKGGGNSYVYRVSAGAISLPNLGDAVDHTWAAWDGVDDITAANGANLAIVEISAASLCVAAGIGVAVSN